MPASCRSIPHAPLPEPDDLDFEGGRSLAAELGYSTALLDAMPAAVVESFAGVGHYLDLLGLRPGETVLDLGAGLDAFCAAMDVGGAGYVVGIAATYAELRKATRLRTGPGWSHMRFVESRIESLPFTAESFDAVVANGTVNRSLRMDEVFSEAARVLRRGGRLALADIVSLRGESAYLRAIDAAGLEVGVVRRHERRSGSVAVLAVKR